MKMTQIEFRQSFSMHTIHKVVWVKADEHLKVGDKVLFKGDELKQWWTVSKVYSIASCDYEDLDKKWGLDLPKSQRTER